MVAAPFKTERLGIFGSITFRSELKRLQYQQVYIRKQKKNQLVPTRTATTFAAYEFAEKSRHEPA